MEYLYGSTIKTEDASRKAIRVDEQGNLCVVPPITGIPQQFFLTAAGNGTGSYNANLNFTTLTDWYYQADNIFDIYTVDIAIVATGQFKYDSYGGITTGLTNGVKLLYKIPSLSFERVLLSGISFKKNYEWLGVTSNTQLTSFPTSGDVLRITFDMRTDYGKPFRLNPGEQFAARFNDDLTTLTQHSFGLRGIRQ